MKDGWKIGDICYHTNHVGMRFIGVVVDVNAVGVPRIYFHNSSDGMWLAGPMYIQESLPVWVGRIPVGTDWDV